VDRDNKTVTINHEAIEGLMPAMEMPFKIDNPRVIEGIKVGNQVHGLLDVRDADYVITELRKR
jgi:Cu/Ag efflux protein CusF